MVLTTAFMQGRKILLGNEEIGFFRPSLQSGYFPVESVTLVSGCPILRSSIARSSSADLTCFDNPFWVEGVW
jgi:hypothetical protein